MRNSKDVFEEVFGRTFETINYDKNKDPIKIDSTSIIHIPGVIKHWQKEIENRRNEIIEFENRSFFEKFNDWIGGDEAFEEASGDELYDMNPSELAEDLMEKIERDPTDNRKRLDLIRLISRRKDELTIENLRDLYLQAIVACSFREISNQGLTTLLKTQEAYLSRLLKICKNDDIKLEKLLKAPLLSKGVSKQRLLVEAYRRKISQNMAFIQFFITFTRQGYTEIPSSPDIEINLNDIKRTLLGGNKAPEKTISQLLSDAHIVISKMLFVVLLHSEIPHYVDFLTKLAPTHPLPSLIKARLYRNKFKLLRQQQKSYKEDESIFPRIMERFELARQSYLTAFQKADKPSEAKFAKTIRKEFAELILEVKTVVGTDQNKNLKPRSLSKYLAQADEMLKSIKDEKAVPELAKRLQSAIAEINQ